MRKSRYSEEQIVGMLREQEAGVSTKELCRKHGISDATFLQVQGQVRRHDGVGCPAASYAGDRDCQAEEASGRTDAGQCGAEGSGLKKLLTPDVKRRAAHHLMEAHELSERRACRLARLDRPTFQYRKRDAGDECLRERLRDLAGERRCSGYRRLSILLAREGLNANHKKLYRFYRQEGLAVWRRRGRKRATGTRCPMVLTSGPSQRWSLDFVSDALTDGRRFRTLCVVDDFTREALAVVADTSLSGVRGGREMDRIIA